jgi:phospholipase C
MSDFQQRDEASQLLPKAAAPDTPSQLFQEKGSVFSRALPYVLYCHARPLPDKELVQLVFENKGKKGAVYHVYDMNDLERIPRRYTVEAGKQLSDEWDLKDKSQQYHLEVFGPNGYFQSFKGSAVGEEPLVRIEYDHKVGGLSIYCENRGKETIQLEVKDNAYGYGPSEELSIPPQKSRKKFQQLTKSGNWYDYSMTTSSGMEYRFAGRVETAKHGITDPAMAQHLS